MNKIGIWLCSFLICLISLLLIGLGNNGDIDKKVVEIAGFIFLILSSAQCILLIPKQKQHFN